MLFLFEQKRAAAHARRRASPTIRGKPLSLSFKLLRTSGSQLCEHSCERREGLAARSAASPWRCLSNGGFGINVSRGVQPRLLASWIHVWLQSTPIALCAAAVAMRLRIMASPGQGQP